MFMRQMPKQRIELINKNGAFIVALVNGEKNRRESPTDDEERQKELAKEMQEFLKWPIIRVSK